jgi:hypothetical protein
MTFLQPWAWIGLVAVAAPIVAHLLARRSARRLPFPTVRFLPAAIQTPISRDRLTDVGLLVVRCLVLVAAAAALAQPVWLTADRRRTLGESVARAIVVDSGVVNAADKLAGQLSAESTVARVTRADAPARLLGEAATWLAQQPMRREIVVVSDFPAQSLSKADVDGVPAGIGIKLVPVSPGGRSRAAVELRDGPELLTAAADRANALAARDAASAQTGTAAGRKDRSIALLFPGHEGRDALLKSARDIDEPWMFDVVRAIAQDRLVAAAAAETGKPVADILAPLAGPINGERHLVLVMSAQPASLMSAAVMRAAAHAVAPASTADVSVTHTAEQLKAWERPPAAVAPDDSRVPEESRGRWLWLAALVLMVIERVITQRAQRARHLRTAAHAEIRDVSRVA